MRNIIRKLHKSFVSYSRGFTLLEMIVSLGIFMIIAVIAVGSLVRITSLNRQAQSLQSAMNNVNYVLESMSREMRVGYHFHCGTETSFSNANTLTAQACPSPSPTSTAEASASDLRVIAFNSSQSGKNQDDSGSCQLIYAYWFDTSIKKAKQEYCDDKISISELELPNVIATDIIDTANVKINSISAANRTELQVITSSKRFSWFAIRLRGYSGIRENEKNRFDIRTGISQRISD